MAWEHIMAGKLNQAEKQAGAPWFTGEVVSPVRTVAPDGTEHFSGPLIVSALKGQLPNLRADRLQVCSHVGQLYAGMTVALVGTPGLKAPGGQSFLIVGVI